MSDIDLSVTGMTCGGCVRSVRGALEAVPGVRAVEVDLEAGRARVQAEPGLAPKLVEAVFDAGFEAALWPGTAASG